MPTLSGTRAIDAGANLAAQTASGGRGRRSLLDGLVQGRRYSHISFVKRFILIVVLALTLPWTALAQTTGPTPYQLRTFQLRLNDQQQQLNQLRLRQPLTPTRDRQLQSLQQRLNQQQLELQRLKRQQQSCARGPC